MYPYTPPIEDYRFLLEHVLGFDAAMREMGRDDFDAELLLTVLGEAGRLCAERLHPLNRVGDEHGCRLDGGEVITPPGFAEAWREFAEAGWPALSASEEWGGQGLPFTAQLWFDEMAAAANLSFGLIAALTRGACETLEAHASPELKEIWLRPLVSGQWTGAMALTESNAGSDLSVLRSKAEPRADGSYAITGTKIFISSGDHDFGGNVVHLVLARLTGAEEGVKGISMFLVPKYLPDGNGQFIERNELSVGTLEEKMGIHAQPTCVMNYDGASGWLVGEPGRGLAAMFTMMNAERLVVGIEGLGIAGAAYQQAAAYARERLQGRGARGEPGPVPIITHADIRRMLMNVRCFVEAGRALAGWTALQMDRSRSHPDAEQRARSAEIVALLTPVIKAAFTDLGFQSAVEAQQVFGGHGYVREWGMEQYVRDARIAQIYEGTNGIQAMDLAARKLAVRDGAAVHMLLDIVAADLEAAAATDRAADVAKAVQARLQTLRAATDLVRTSGPAAQTACAVDYLRLFALIMLGWMWARMAAAAAGDIPLHQSKPILARFFADKILPQVEGLAASVHAGESVVYSMREKAF